MKVYNVINLSNSGDEGYVPSVSVETYTTREAAQKAFNEDVEYVKERYEVDDEEANIIIENDNENIFTMTDSMNDEYICIEIQEVEVK